MNWFKLKIKLLNIDCCVLLSQVSIFMNKPPYSLSSRIIGRFTYFSSGFSALSFIVTRVEGRMEASHCASLKSSSGRLSPGEGVLDLNLYGDVPTK